MYHKLKGSKKNLHLKLKEREKRINVPYNTLYLSI